MGHFTKGQSGNPNGRPRKGKSLTEALEKALKQKRADGKKNNDLLAESLLDMAINKKDVMAIRYIYDRIDGKPTETIQADVKGNIINPDAILKKLEGALLNDYCHLHNL